MAGVAGSPGSPPFVSSVVLDTGCQQQHQAVLSSHRRVHPVQMLHALNWNWLHLPQRYIWWWPTLAAGSMRPLRF